MHGEIDAEVGSDDCQKEQDFDDEMESVCSQHSSFSQREVYDDYEILNQYGKLISSWEDDLLYHDKLQIWTLLIAFIAAYLLLNELFAVMWDGWRLWLH